MFSKKHIRLRQVFAGVTVALTGLALTACSTSDNAGDNGGSSEVSLESIQERGYILYGFNGERPYNWMDETGEITGSEIDIARAVAAKLGVDEVQGVAMDFDSFVPALQAGLVDTVMPIFVKAERCEIVPFAEPHLIEGQGVIVPEGNPKNIVSWDSIKTDGNTIGVIAGTTPDTFAVDFGIDESNIVRFTDTTNMRAGMQADRVDAIIEASSTIRELFESIGDDFERLDEWIAPEGQSFDFYASFPFQPGASELADAWNEALQEMLADGSIDEITAPYGFTAADRPTADTPDLETLCAE